MIGMNIMNLRRRENLTQEQLAEIIGVSRQAIAKWEKGESMPDLENCVALAKAFDVTVDDLILYQENDAGLPLPPKGKHFFGSVTVGERGQIVIPKKARELFGIHPGDQLLVLGDEGQGIAVIPQEALTTMLRSAGLEVLRRE